MRDLLRSLCAFCIATFALPHVALAADEKAQDKGSRFVQSGFYLGAGFALATPAKWNNDFNNDLNDDSTELANARASALRDALTGTQPALLPVTVSVNGADLEDDFFGVSGVIGYRITPALAVELEGEWLSGSNKSALDVRSVAQFPDPMPGVPGALIQQESTGAHMTEISKIWMVTANVKIYPPLTGRFQPFVKAGLGVQHAELDTLVATTGLTSTNADEVPSPPYPLDADFTINRSRKNLDGALRFAGGIDLYATEHIFTEVNVGYVVPFAELESMRIDYLSVQLKLMYRF